LVNETAIALESAGVIITPILCATLIGVTFAGITCAYKILSNPRCTDDAKRRFRKFAVLIIFSGVLFVISLIFSITDTLRDYSYYVIISGCIVLMIALIMMIPWKTNPIDITEPLNNNQQNNQDNRGYG